MILRLQERGWQQGALNGFTLTAERFLQQVVHHIAMTATERLDEADRIVMVPQGKRRVTQQGVTYHIGTHLSSPLGNTSANRP